MILTKERYDHSELCAVGIVSYSCRLVMKCWLLSAGCESFSLPPVAPRPHLSPSLPASPTVGITQLFAGALRREAWREDCANASVWQCTCDGDGDGLEYIWEENGDRQEEKSFMDSSLCLPPPFIIPIFSHTSSIPSFLFYQGRWQGQASHNCRLVIGCHNRARALKGQQPSLPKLSSRYVRGVASSQSWIFPQNAFISHLKSI